MTTPVNGAPPVARRVAALEAARLAEALADFRAAFDAWVEHPRAEDDPATLEEAEARVAELRAGLSPEELARSDRLRDALGALVEPDTTPAGVARAAAVVAEVDEFGLRPGAPPYLALEVLAEHFQHSGGEGSG